MKRLPLSDLPRFSPWPARLLGIEEFKTGSRTVAKMRREYGRDKFGTYLKQTNARREPDAMQIRLLERGMTRDAKTCFSLGARLYEATVAEAEQAAARRIRRAVGESVRDADTVVELGAGYGYNLSLVHEWYPRLTLIGGELTSAGVDLGRRVARGRWQMVPFNFHDARWRLFEGLRGKRVLVLTRHSVEMLPESHIFLEGMRKYRASIASVLQFEPLYEFLGRTDMLSLLRRRYIDMNHYNTDLWTELQTRDIRVDSCDAHAIGLNPLFPESIIRWHFRRS